jgi:hypothetical protein
MQILSLRIRGNMYKTLWNPALLAIIGLLVIQLSLVVPFIYVDLEPSFIMGFGIILMLISAFLYMNPPLYSESSASSLHITPSQDETKRSKVFKRMIGAGTVAFCSFLLLMLLFEHSYNSHVVDFHEVSNPNCRDIIQLKV